MIVHNANGTLISLAAAVLLQTTSGSPTKRPRTGRYGWGSSPNGGKERPPYSGSLKAWPLRKNTSRYGLHRGRFAVGMTCGSNLPPRSWRHWKPKTAHRKQIG